MHRQSELEPACPTTTTSRDVVIVGGGATAVSTFTQLTAKLSPGDSVTIVDPNPVGFGHAFGTSDPLLLCNTSVDVTSLRADDGSDLLDYLSSRGWPAHPEDFVPRYLVGQYCRERYQESRRRAERRGIRIEHRRTRATAVRRETNGSYSVELTGSTPLFATDVLLCLGLDRPVLPEPVRRHAGHPAMLDAPYPVDRLRELPRDAEVLVLGTKLSAIDAALVLCRDGRRTVMTSPSGELPAVRTRLRRPERPLLDTDRWQRLTPGTANLDREVARLLVEAVNRADRPLPLREQTSPAGAPATRLERELALAAAGRVPWQDVVAEVIDTVNDWTAAWPATTRADVLGRYRTVMSRYISAIPERNARLLAEHLAAGRLSVATGYPASIEPEGPASWRVEWPDGRVEHFTHVVCGTGFQKPQLSLAGPGSYRIGPPGPGAAVPEITADLRLREPEHPTPDRIWVVGAAAHHRTAIVNYLNAAAKQAARIAAQFATAVPV
ncbi:MULTISPECIES: FAD/NAD(P)-binding protein [unclassified Kitasatospora]|uniref:FAD/NAD(P)-binding protein n=1 Tax=unclassified Kitasatospora TaxID=2633591 RepID=UPI000710FAA2|nr:MULTISPECIES: FAD/NAD(P)-binding protein [unclassified Kitasatospora]KQV19509.1 hypothetical protein ASC99_22745 [Kitasatospora sp. Root107]KRB72877.1 hypothetical protein ASE03_21640 [Kitasatospora sp. Root187]